MFFIAWLFFCLLYHLQGHFLHQLRSLHAVRNDFHDTLSAVLDTTTSVTESESRNFLRAKIMSPFKQHLANKTVVVTGAGKGKYTLNFSME